MLNKEEVLTAIQDAKRFIEIAENYLDRATNYDKEYEACVKKYGSGTNSFYQHCPVDRRSTLSGLTRAQSLVLWRQLATMRKSSE